MTRRIGKTQPEFLTAERTRSRASCTAASGSPTTVNAGKPKPMSASTSTSAPSSPTTAQVRTFASTSLSPIPSCGDGSSQRANNQRLTGFSSR